MKSFNFTSGRYECRLKILMKEKMLTATICGVSWYHHRTRYYGK